MSQHKLAEPAQGTFLVRPSLSLAGAMVLSVVVAGAVKHMALDGNQLDTRSLEARSMQPRALACHSLQCKLWCKNKLCNAAWDAYPSPTHSLA